MNQASTAKQEQSATSAADIELTDAEFDSLREVVYEHSRIKLATTKKQMLRRRVQKRMNAMGLNSVKAYCDCLRIKGSSEITQFINEVTTNLTYFFRENHHFEYLQKIVLPKIIAGKTQKRLRIWSAGCSTGEEPYSTAIVLKEMESQLAGWDAKILASDLSFDVLSNCRKGVYDISQISEHTNSQRMSKWFTGSGNEKTVNPILHKLITFNQLNLMDEWPMQKKFDIIFCRNVMIYFDKPTKQRLVDRFADMLIDKGTLFIGHSESLMNISDRFSLVEKTTYQKKD